MNQLERRESSANQNSEKAIAFFDTLTQSGVFSHIALVNGRDDTGSASADIYALATKKVDPKDQQQGKQLQTVLDSFNDFAFAVRSKTFLYLHLVDPTKYTPNALKQALQEQYRTRVRLNKLAPTL